MINRILQLQADIYHYATTDFDTGLKQNFQIGYSPAVAFSKMGDLYALSFFGDGLDEEPTTKATDFDYETNFAFCHFLDFISESKHAQNIVALSFCGADEGANGTKSWNFDRLANSEVIFPNLQSFAVQLTDLGDHNTSIIDSDFTMAENGVIAKLVKKMPNLKSLMLPSAPNKDFFEIGNHPLQHLKIQAGYAHQDFIKNLSRSNNFPNLSVFDYAECIEFIDDMGCEYTPFEDFKELFVSKAFASVEHFTLRNSKLTKEQLFELQQTNDVQFLNIIAHGGKYVNH